ncbi:hypothetical protein [Saccharicrinis sp. 156]|uniref:hypothetical protein n=1 Tax=Saccharicrinis sp. 156 TaxID=3417574 RepID=UPI003D3513A0
MNSFAIFVNTCDKFDDCWDPFFKLFSEYWPNYKGKIYLNTEYKDYSYKDLDIVALKIAEENRDAHKITWSECLRRALNKIEEDIVLYVQEDYFFKDRVKDEIVNEFAQLMISNKDIHCIQLTDQGSPAEIPSEYKKLWKVPRFHRDRISCQASFWRRAVLNQHIRTYETAWNFEWWGSKRSAILDHNFYVVDPGWVEKDKFELIPYVFTGVIGGRWFKEVVPLFEKHNILVDYSKRGFFEQKPKPIKKRISAKFKRFPIEVRSSMDLILLKLNIAK